MEYKLVDTGEILYIECVPDGSPLASEADVLDLLMVCGENDTDKLLVHSEVFPDDFFNLMTGLAGMMLQKLANYHVRMALVMSDERASQGRFCELAMESNRGRDFGVFETKEAAEEWLSSAGG